MFELSIKDHISSAHFLRGYEGKCKHLHGHNWVVEVVIAGDQLDEVGMLADFGVLKEQLKDFLAELDHLCLNETVAFKEVNPTSENIACYVYREFSKRVHPLTMKYVKVWESDNCSVTYYE